MIRVVDALKLAATKLRIRRIRTTISVLVASLLFGVIVLAIIILQGGLDSMNKFSSGSLSGRYLTSVNYASKSTLSIAMDGQYPNSVKTRATEIYTKTIADKKAAAKKLNIDYDPSTEQKPVDGNNQLDPTSPSAIQASSEYLATLTPAMDELKDTMKSFRPKNIYEQISSVVNHGQFKPMDNNSEDFYKQSNDSTVKSGSAVINFGINFGWSFVDQAITRPFMLSDKQLKEQTNMSDIPVVAPLAQVEGALGLKPLPNNTPSQEKLDRIKYIRDHAQTVTFSICYRNTASQSQIDSAITVAKEIDKNKTNKNYIKPSLIYGLPATNTCGPATITSDTRTLDEKNLVKNQAEFDRMFGQETEPIQEKVTFRVVGLSPNGLNAYSLSGIGSLLETIAGSTLNGQWVVPQQLFDAMSNKHDFDQFLPSSQKPTDYTYGVANTIVEFSSANDAKNFITKTGCGESMSCSSNNMTAYYFGSNSVLIDDVKNQAASVLGYIAIGVSVIAAIIMMSTIGRVISDSRRETAVFRAIGAKRNDIRLIYVIYTFVLLLIITVMSLIIGTAAALWVNAVISPEITVQMHLIYIFSNDNLSFSVIGIWWQALAVLVGLIFVAGFTGILLPLSLNLGRSPINDMRDDT